MYGFCNITLLEDKGSPFILDMVVKRKTLELLLQVVVIAVADSWTGQIK